MFINRFRVIATALSCVAAALVTPAPAAADPFTYYVKNSHSGLCLGVRALPIENGTDIVQRPCGDPLSLRWKLEEDGSAYYRFVVADVRVQTAVCLDVAYASDAVGAPLQTWQCLDTSWNQEFRIDSWPSRPGLFDLHPSHTGNKCLDIWRRQTTSGTPVVQENCWFEPSQLFSFHTTL
jgi:hypothetical protein